MQEQASYRFARNYHWIGIVVLCAVSIPFHFVYEWLGEAQLVGYFFPVNESIWEHLKLAFWPTLLWWVIGYFLFRNKHNLSAASWFYASFFSLLSSPLIVASYYYIAEAGLEYESPVMNIVILFIGFLVGQLLALHVYRYTRRPNKIWFTMLTVLVIALGIFLTIWTYTPPELPLFIPPGSEE